MPRGLEVVASFPPSKGGPALKKKNPTEWVLLRVYSRPTEMIFVVLIVIILN